MSIVIKSDELNLLIYKYLSQANLSHTAYSLFNEAQLQTAVSQYKYDIKSGQLISILQRGLIFNQIESHVTINNYQQCNEPFHLIKPHTCKIIEKIREDNDKFMQQLNEQIFTSMRRTSSVHNTLEPNKDYQQIIYEQKSSNYLQRIPLFLQGTKDVKFGGDSDLLYAYDPQFYTVSIIKIKGHDLNLQGILPCSYDNALSQPQVIHLANNLLIRVYPNNVCEITRIYTNPQTQQHSFGHENYFTLPLKTRCSSIKQNPKINSLLAFTSMEGFCVINIQKGMCICSGQGLFEWKNAAQYFSYDSTLHLITLKSLLNPQINKAFNTYYSKIDNICISESQIYFFATSLTDNKIFVYTLDKPDALYIFNFGNHKNGTHKMQSQDQDQKQNSVQEQYQNLLQCLWISNNSSDDLLILTNKTIRTFGIQLNNYLKIIEISSYDVGVTKVAVMKRNQSQSWAVCMGIQSIIVYDINQGKIERIQYQRSQSDTIYQFPTSMYVGLKINNNFYLTKDKDFQPLFV